MEIGIDSFAAILPDPDTGSMIRRLKPIGTPGHILGTDDLGRDMLSRLIHGARITPIIGLLPIIFAYLIAIVLGTVAGYVGGIVNSVIMRVVDVFFAFPSVLLAIAISGALGSGVVNIIISLTIVFVPPLTRVAESAAASVRNLDYVEAARASGAGALTILRVHVLRNIVWPVIGYATSMASIAMIIASGLSFLGIGVKPPTAELGTMLNSLKSAIYVNPVIAALPGALIFLTSLSLNVLSDRIRRGMNARY